MGVQPAAGAAPPAASDLKQKNVAQAKEIKALKKALEQAQAQLEKGEKEQSTKSKLPDIRKKQVTKSLKINVSL